MSAEIKKEVKNDKIVNDGWNNVFTGLGGDKDVTQNTAVGSKSAYYYDNEQMQENFWINSPLGNNVMSILPNDMTREGCEIENDVDKMITNKLKSLDTMKTFNDALKKARLTGGAIILIGMPGEDIEKPVKTVDDIWWLKVFDYHSIEIMPDDINKDPLSKNYKQPEFFQLRTKEGKHFRAHKSRCLVFKGMDAPLINSDYKRDFFGITYLSKVHDPVMMVETVFQYVAQIMKEFTISKIKMKGLANLIASGNEETVVKRVSIIDRCRSLFNTVLIDADNDDYIKETTAVAGLSDILETEMYYLCGITGYPVTKLFGRSPAGMNATGEGDKINYYDMVKSEQETKMYKQLQTLVNYVNMIPTYTIKEEPIVKFVPLFQMSEKEEMELKKLQADMDKIYYEIQALNPEEIRESRFANGYSTETTLSADIDFNAIDENKE